MSKGLPRSASRATLPRTPIQSQTITLDAVAISVAGTTGVGFGSVVATGLPEGNVLLLGAVANLQFSGSGSDANLVDTWEGDFGVGSTPADDATITAGDIDIIQSTALAAATAEVSPLTRGTTDLSAGVILDNTASTLEINVNLLIDDADIGGTVAITCTGEIYLSYIVLGDD